MGRNKRKENWDEGGRWTGFATMVYTPPKNPFPSFWFHGGDAVIRIASKLDLCHLIERYASVWSASKDEVHSRIRNARNVDNLEGEPVFSVAELTTDGTSLSDFLEAYSVSWPSAA